jgi:hypothetical protein
MLQGLAKLYCFIGFQNSDASKILELTVFKPQYVIDFTFKTTFESFKTVFASILSSTLAAHDCEITMTFIKTPNLFLSSS